MRILYGLFYCSVKLINLYCNEYWIDVNVGYNDLVVVMGILDLFDGVRGSCVEYFFVYMDIGDEENVILVWGNN